MSPLGAEWMGCVVAQCMAFLGMPSAVQMGNMYFHESRTVQYVRPLLLEKQGYYGMNSTVRNMPYWTLSLPFLSADAPEAQVDHVCTKALTRPHVRFSLMINLLL